jgi:hypothetical protein
LVIEPSDRLGAKGADEVKAHPWFAGVDWANLRNTTSPFVPKLGKSEEDTFYFEARNQVYHTTWEGDTSTHAGEEEEQAARVRNFSIINIPQLMTLNQRLVVDNDRQGTHHLAGPSLPFPSPRPCVRCARPQGLEDEMCVGVRSHDGTLVRASVSEYDVVWTWLTLC